MQVVLVITVCAANILCFLVGVKCAGNPVTHKTSKEKPRRLHREKKIEKTLQDRQIEVMLQNINSYDGTGLGQQDIPG